MQNATIRGVKFVPITIKPGADDRNDIVFVSFLLRFFFVLETFSDRYTIVFRTFSERKTIGKDKHRHFVFGFVIVS